MIQVKCQKPPYPYNISDWSLDDEYEGIFPKGSREKSSLFCIEDDECPGLITDHRYLFKKSFHRYLEQYWVEIIAYRLGCLMGVPVPPAFVAMSNNEDGVIIEWFYDEQKYEGYIDGGDLIKGVIPDFDMKTGKQHNLTTVFKMMEALHSDEKFHFETDWINHWAKIFVFDAVIGNTDRHQENWGLIVGFDKNDANVHSAPVFKMRVSPAFDNGTSMGHEIIERKFKNFDNINRLDAYIKKGTHHMKWALADPNRISHIDFIKIFIDNYPSSKNIIMDSLDFDLDQFKNTLFDLTKFEVPHPLTESRACFIFKVFSRRRELILERCGG